MAQLLGMDPARVEALSAQLQAQDGRLNQVAANVDRLTYASLNPAAWGIQPGGLVIAPFSISAVTAATAQVRTALASVDELVGRLFREAAEQRTTSNTNETVNRRVGSTGKQGGFKMPAWVMHPAWSWLNDSIELAGGLLAPFIFLNNPDKVPMFMRKQSNGRGGWRYRSGLLQWGNSTYKNNPVVLKYRTPRLPAWMNQIGRGVPNWAIKTSKVLGPVGTALGGVLSGRDAYVSQYESSSHMSETDRHLRSAAAAATVGGANIAGAVGGAVAGAKIGALVGSIFPGPGTAIGAVAGGIIGGIVGSGVGEKIGSWFNSLW